MFSSSPVPLRTFFNRLIPTLTLTSATEMYAMDKSKYGSRGLHLLDTFPYLCTFALFVLVLVLHPSRAAMARLPTLWTYLGKFYFT